MSVKAGAAVALLESVAVDSASAGWPGAMKPSSEVPFNIHVNARGLLQALELEQQGGIGGGLVRRRVRLSRR